MLTQVLGKLGETSKLMKQKVLQEITEELVRKIVLKLDSFKAISVGDTPADLIKSNVYMHLPSN